MNLNKEAAQAAANHLTMMGFRGQNLSGTNHNKYVEVVDADRQGEYLIEGTLEHLCVKAKFSNFASSHVEIFINGEKFAGEMGQSFMVSLGKIMVKLAGMGTTQGGNG